VLGRMTGQLQILIFGILKAVLADRIFAFPKCEQLADGLEVEQN